MNSCTLNSCSARPGAVDAPTDRKKLHLGLVVDLSLGRDWLYSLIRAIEDSARVHVGPVILLAGEQTSQSHKEACLFRLWRKLDRLLFSSVPLPTDDQLKGYALDFVAGSAAKPSDFRPRVLSAAALDALKRSHLDIIVQIGGEGCISQLAALARYGMWWVPELAPCTVNSLWFRDTFKTHGVFETLLKAYRPEGGQCRILRRSFSANDGVSLSRNQASKRRRISQLIVEEVIRLDKSRGRYLDSLNDHEIDSGSEMPKSAPIASNREFLRFFVSWVMRGVGRRVQRCFFREHWFVAYRSNGGALPTAASMNDFHVLPTAKDRFYADPFSIERNGKTYLFFEDYPFDKGKGLISWVEIDERGNCTKPEIALERQYHLSYPHVFEHGGEIYMVPESLETRTVDLYRAVGFPERWVLEKTLLNNVAAVDPTIFFHNGRVWLFAAGVRSERSINEDLFLFYSDSLWGEWIWHPCNPIISDVRRARPAGRIFFHDQQIIRPAQDCSASYGRAVTFNRIEVLSECRYRETPMATIGPEWYAGNRGTHTFNQSEKLQTVDGRILVRKHTSNREDEAWREDLAATAMASSQCRELSLHRRVSAKATDPQRNVLDAQVDRCANGSGR